MFDKIYSFLKDKNLNESESRDLLNLLNSLTIEITSKGLSLNDSDFKEFLKKVHDSLIIVDTTIRSALFRLIRFCIGSRSHCDILISEEIHWIIISSLEKEVDQVIIERMQALKIIRKVIMIAPEKFPVSYARSLVAIASHKDDNIRRICVETLRELCIINPEVVSDVDGFTCLLEAVIDPSTSDMGQAIVLSILYLINSPTKRLFVRPFLDLRILTAPFSDLDTELSDLMLRWKSAKSAFVLLMRSWAGMLYLTSDPLGLATLTDLLKDDKVSSSLHEILLDAFSEVFQPVVTKSLSANSLYFWRTGAQNMFDEDDFRGMSTKNGSNERGRENSNYEMNKSTDSRKSYMNSFLKATSPFSPQFLRKNSGATASKDRSLSDPSLPNTQYGYGERREVGDVDPIYNMLNSYAALLSSAFIHCGIIESLVHLGTRDETDLGKKARSLLLDLLHLICRVFPHSVSTELMTMPSLLEFATSSANHTGGTHRASQILISLANEFSIPSNSQTNHTGTSNQSHSQHAQNLGIITARSRGMLSDKSLTSQSNMGGSASGAPKSSSSAPAPIAATTLKNLTVDIKAFSAMKVKSLPSVASSSSNYNLLQYLNAKFITPSDKVEFRKQIEASKTIGKEGKEPLKWDWALIQDMLEGSFTSADRLTEVLETKWMRRVAGFFRCSNEDKAHFAIMEWDSSNLRYLQCLCALYYVLANESKGIAFLENDRRTTIFQDIAREIEQVVAINGQGWQSSSSPKLVFRFSSVSQSMVREYFVFIGLIVGIDQGRMFVNNTSLFDSISTMGQKQPLEYLSRAIVTGLVFSDKGYLSRSFIQVWLSNPNCSSQLRAYIEMLLLVMLRSRPYEFQKWCTETICFLMSCEQTPSPYLIKVILEAIQDKRILRAFVSYVIQTPKIMSSTESTKLYTRILADEDGVDFLQSKNSLDSLITKWLDKDCLNYALSLESTLTKALNPSVEKASDKPGEYIPIYLDGDKDSSDNLEFMGGYDLNLEGFKRIPWNIEAKLTSASSSQSQQGSTEFLKVDTFLGKLILVNILYCSFSYNIPYISIFIDTSTLPFPCSSELVSDRMLYVQVRGIVLNSKGLPVGQAIPTNSVIANCLLAGACSVQKDGKVTHSINSVDAKKKALLSLQTQVQASRPTTANQADSSLEDAPVSSCNEQFYEWSTCKEYNRKGNAVELGDGKFSVTVPDYPVTWIFKRNTALDSSTKNQSQSTVVLIEIQYLLKLESGLSTLVPISHHLFGELGKSHRGCAIITDKKIVNQQIEVAKNETMDEGKRKSALWTLGHLCTSELGCSAVLEHDASFIDWCVSYVCSGENLGLRGTMFYILGLVSRSKRGAAKLFQLNWVSSPAGSNAAVAIPQNASVLFQHQYLTLGNAAGPKDSLSRVALAKPTSSVGSEVIELISKMPGVILFGDSKTRLEGIKTKNADIFKNRELYVAVRKILDNNAYKLSARRDVLSLFSADARLKS